MIRNPRFQQKVLALVVSLLLFAQLLGLHRHQHAEAGAPAHAVASELHFGDAGIHDEEHATVGTATHHAHGDSEAKALDDSLSRLSGDLLPIGLLMVLSLLLAIPPARRASLQRPSQAVPTQHPFTLHPPANGPPTVISPLY